MGRCFQTISINQPIIIHHDDFSIHLKENVWLLLVCLIAAIIHIKYIFTPIYLVGDEALFIQNGLWIYDYFGPFYYKAVKYAFWTVIILTLVAARIRSTANSDGALSNHKTKFASYLCVSVGVCCLVIYFILIRDLSFDITVVRYPPLQKFLYLISYYIVGINHLGPRMVQFIFYILSAVYLYRIISLFYDKETALLGASIYLFSPVIFTYAHFAELASGVIFFIIIISYYFLRYLMYQDNRDLLLSSYFIGTGFLYKRDIFLMLFICSAYLVMYKFKNKDLNLMRALKILSLPLFPIIPWLIIGKYFNWRSAWISLSNFTSFDTVISYLLLIQAQMSWTIFFLFIASIIFIFIKRKNHLSLFMGCLFTAFYCFYTSQALTVAVDRFAMAFYPTIAVFLALLLSTFAHKIRWKHSFKSVFLVLTIYLVFLCAVPSLSERLIVFKNVKEQYYPNEKAMRWVRDNIKNGDKILTLRFKPDFFYMDKYDIDPDKIISFWYDHRLDEISTTQKLREFCKLNGVTYILFPDGPYYQKILYRPILSHLKENKVNEFIKIEEFNLHDNYIYICKFKARS